MPSESHPFHPSAQAGEHSLNEADNRAAWVVFGAFVLGLTAAYWNMLTYTSSYWGNDLYSHGWIVPIFAGGLFWFRSRLPVNLSSKEVLISGLVVAGCASVNIMSAAGFFEMTAWMGLLEVLVLIALFFFHMRHVKLTTIAPSERWIGVAIVLVCLLLRLRASSLDQNPLDRLTYVGALLGICQLVGGTTMLRWAGPPLGFLVFMFPLPHLLEGPVLLTLQKAAAISSAWILQLLGVPALREGNRIMIDQLPLDVADACSGLRMGTIFGAMAVAMAMIINRPWWDRLAILLSAVPIALLTNVIRITATALLYMAFPESEAVKHAVHDWAGFLMMPVALGFLWLELQWLSAVSVPMETEDFTAFDAARG